MPVKDDKYNFNAGPTPTKGDVARYIASQKTEKPKPLSGWDLVKAAGNDTWVTSRIYHRLMEPGAGDGLFSVDAEMLKEHAADIPYDYLDKLSESESEDQFLYRLKDIKSRMKARETLGQMGYSGLASPL